MINNFLLKSLKCNKISKIYINFLNNQFIFYKPKYFLSSVLSQQSQQKQKDNFQYIPQAKKQQQKALSHFNNLQQDQLKQQSITIKQNQSKQNGYQKFPIQKYQIGQRFDRYLKNSQIQNNKNKNHEQSNHLNWTLIQKFIRNKQIFIKNSSDIKIKNNDYRLQQGDILYVKRNIVPLFLQSNGKTISNNQNLERKIDYQYAKNILDKMMIFDNKNITILNKPAGYSVQGGENVKQNLFTLMSARYKKQFVYVSHRLDKPTTGIILFCKNLRTTQLLQQAMQSRKFYNKYYLALTLGQKINNKQDYIRCNVEWTNKHKARIVESLEKQDSKDCITYYKKLHSQINMQQWQGKTQQDQYKNINLLGMKLITGRKHQIRCHLSGYLNNPILNDQRYGGKIIKQKLNDKEKNLINNKEQINNIKDENFIFLHALMTTIKSHEIIQSVFEIPQKIRNQTYGTEKQHLITENQNGKLMIKNGDLKVIGKLPKSWKKLTQNQKIEQKQNKNKKLLLSKNNNNKTIQSFKLNFDFNQIQLGEQIQISQINLLKKNKLQRNIIAFN